MEELISRTAAYRIFKGDKSSGRLSHAYMLYFSDAGYLREVLKQFALVFFGCGKEERNGRLIEAEGLSDLKIYPKPEKKLTVDAATEITEDVFLQPLEGDKKLYIISGLEEASALFQNKLLKILEEPPQGVYFLIGVTSLAPVLDTIKSRVKTLEIPPFSAADILAALQRKGANPENERVAAACGGALSVAENMLREHWFAEVRQAASEICRAYNAELAVRTALKYGDCKYKTELLAEMQRTYYGELERYAKDENYNGVLAKGAVIYAVESVNKAFADMKFNANFSSLLYDLTLRIASENEKW